MSTVPPRAQPEIVSRPNQRPLRLPTAPPELVPARMINEALYCERLLYLEWAQGELEDNHFTVDGRTVHRRADVPGGELPPRPSEQEGAARDANAEALERAGHDGEDERPYKARSVWLSSERLRITTPPPQPGTSGIERCRPH